MASKATIDAIQKDWKEREMIEVVHLNILKAMKYYYESRESDRSSPEITQRRECDTFFRYKITKFLNEFEVSVRYKLSTLAERVGSLERYLEYCETAVKNKEQLQPLSLTPEPPSSAGGR